MDAAMMWSLVILRWCWIGEWRGIVCEHDEAAAMDILDDELGFDDQSMDVRDDTVDVCGGKLLLVMAGERASSEREADDGSPSWLMCDV
jgi:hypothetical protein